MEIILGLLLSDWDDFPLEGLMELPPCPVCEKGLLLPFSDDKKPYAMWICSWPSCAYTISRSLTAETYYKGTATLAEKIKGEKKYVEYNF